MASDGPPWTVGSNCTITLAHASISGGEATGFYVKPDSYRMLLPKVWYPGTNVKAIAGVATPLAAGKRVIECVVLARSGLLHVDGHASQLTAAQWHNGPLAYAALANVAMTLVDPRGAAFTVGFEEHEDRLAPLGGQFLLEW